MKAIKDSYGFSLRESKQWMDNAPCELPDLPPYKENTLASALRKRGATVILDPGPLDRLTALGCIHAAEAALGEGDMNEARRNLRSALTLLGDLAFDELGFLTRWHATHGKAFQSKAEQSQDQVS